jgi:hypothetical protein
LHSSTVARVGAGQFGGRGGSFVDGDELDFLAPEGDSGHEPVDPPETNTQLRSRAGPEKFEALCQM